MKFPLALIPVVTFIEPTLLAEVSDAVCLLALRA